MEVLQGTTALRLPLQFDSAAVSPVIVAHFCSVSTAKHLHDSHGTQAVAATHLCSTKCASTSQSVHSTVAHWVAEWHSLAVTCCCAHRPAGSSCHLFLSHACAPHSL